MDKQIEEMRNDLNDAWHRDIIIGDKFKDVAEKLTKLGYRKILEGAVILTSDQKIWLEHEWYKLGYKQGFKEGVEAVKKQLTNNAQYGFSMGVGLYTIEADALDEICKEITEGE